MDRETDKGERILVCLSPSPSNRKVIAAAAKMAGAFSAVLTAVYIKPSYYEDLSEDDKNRIQENIRYAEQQGASVITITGNDIPVQVAEYAHVSGATKLVVGRSGMKRRHFWDKTTLTEQIILSVPGIDVYIIPDSEADLKWKNKDLRRKANIKPTAKDSLIALLILMCASGVGLLFTYFGFSEANIITVYILAVLIISVATVSPIYGAAGSLFSVLLFNYLFIEPRFSFHTYETEYLVTFAIMLTASLITGTLANRLKENARHSAREAFRTKLLFETNRLLQKAETEDLAIKVTARQIIKLLDRDAVVYPAREDGKAAESLYFYNKDSSAETDPDADAQEIAAWVLKNRLPAGKGFENFRNAKNQYYPISINERCYGVVAVMVGGKALETFELSIFSSMLGECALALDSIRNAREKEQAAVMARNEQLRSNLLRSVSHDIRTPLTSISGNASTLMSSYEQLDRETLEQIFSDIYDDSEWLIDLVENLLFISRIENGKMELHMTTDIVGDVIGEALKHIDRNSSKHIIKVEEDEDILIARMDSRLISQVLINLVNNAVKNTQGGSEIDISIRREGKDIIVSVKDNGPGIPDEMKPHIFEMFYTGESKIADGRRGLGLGLALCKSIVEAHGGSIRLEDNRPSGCCFSFSLPEAEVNIYE